MADANETDSMVLAHLSLTEDGFREAVDGQAAATAAGEQRALLSGGGAAPAAGNDGRQLTDAELAKRNTWRAIPGAVPFIMVNEIVERFSFYGLKAILYVYLTDRLGFGGDAGTAIVHTFVLFSYTSTLFGGWLSDSYLAKFRTVVYLSIVYCLGGAALAITAIPGVTGGGLDERDRHGEPPHWWGMALGLALIAVGTGGIKPVVSAFLGDQFGPDQKVLLSSIFHLFYFCINLGSVGSTILTPILRNEVSYAVAFGVPAVLLFVATLIFVAGYKLYIKFPATGSVVGRTFKMLCVACCCGQSASAAAAAAADGADETGVSATTTTTAAPAKTAAAAAPKRGFLDRAAHRYDSMTIAETKAAFRVLLVFLPMPFFWALFDQSASRWIEQAKHMNRTVGPITILPDQMPVTNPILVMLFIPIFDRGVYPLVRAARASFSPLERMGWGMVLTFTSFVCAGIVQTWIEGCQFADPVTGEPNGEQRADYPSILWQLPQYFLITAGEIMISITGLEFAYTQAPPSMKGVIMAFWQLTVAGGNLIVIIVASANFFIQSIEFFFFAGLMLLSLAVHAIISYSYKYRESAENDPTASRKQKAAEAAAAAAAQPVAAGQAAEDGSVQH